MHVFETELIRVLLQEWACRVIVQIARQLEIPGRAVGLYFEDAGVVKEPNQIYRDIEIEYFRQILPTTSGDPGVVCHIGRHTCLKAVIVPPNRDRYIPRKRRPVTGHSASEILLHPPIRMTGMSSPGGNTAGSILY